MAWKSTFTNKIRKYWLRKVTRVRYYLSKNDAWYDGIIVEKTIDGDSMIIKITTNDEIADTITKFQLLDADGDLAYEGTRSIIKDASEGALIMVEVPLIEK
nr:MAG TPA: hypothetical protein [Caudoviricetes sp.]